MTYRPPIRAVPRPGRIARHILARFDFRRVDLSAERAILDSYGLDLIGQPRILPTAGRSRSLLVDTATGRKILRRYRPGWPLNTIIHEHSILKRLADLDFPAPRLVCTRDGRTIADDGDYYYALFDFVPGASYAATFMPHAHRLKLLEAAGRALADFHRQLAGFAPAGQHHLGYLSGMDQPQHDLAWYTEALRELPARSGGVSDPRGRRQLEWLARRSEHFLEAISRLDQTLRDAPLPRLIIHGDYGLHNLLFSTGGAVTLLDFELARYEWRLSDLVLTLSRMTRAGRQHFMAGYQSTFPLTPDEWRFWPQVYQLRLFQGAVRYWDAALRQESSRRLAGARRRVRQAERAARNSHNLLDLRVVAGPAQDRSHPPRVLMVVRLFYPWIGGTERQAHRLASSLHNKGIPVELVTGWWFRGTPRREVLDGIPITRTLTLWEFFGIRGLRKFGGYLFMASLLWRLWRRRRHYDIIHVHGLNYHTFVAVLAGRWFRRKVLVKLANSGSASDINKMRENRQLALSRYMLPVALKCDRFVALNETIVKELAAAGIQPEQIAELPNGVDTALTPPRLDYALHDPIRIVFIGRLHEQKGLDVLLAAFQQILPEVLPDVIHLHLIGDGPQRDKLVGQAEQLGIARYVTFAGQTGEVLAALQMADIFVLPSRAEGISNALLEAMACGLPVVASDIPGNRDVVRHGHNGLLFTVNDPDALVACLLDLIHRSDLRRQLGAAARQTIEQSFSLDTVASQYISLYRNLLAAPAVSQTRPAEVEYEPFRPYQLAGEKEEHIP